MVAKRAQTLDEEDIQTAIENTRSSQTPERDTLLVLLTCRMGLRAQEAASIHCEDFLDARGRMKAMLFVSGRGAKYGKNRNLPIHSDVRKALEVYLEKYPIRRGPLFYNQWGKPLASTAVQAILKRLYVRTGLEGCSSHSGRRTFGTVSARRLNQIGCSLKDLCLLMGHSSVETTMIYVEPSDRQAELIHLMGQ